MNEQSPNVAICAPAAIPRQEDRPTIIGRVMSELSPAYFIAIIAGAGIIWHQVNELDEDVSRISQDQQTLSGQFAMINGRIGGIEEKLDDRFGMLQSSLSEIKRRNEKSTDEMKATNQREREATANRLEAIEDVLDDLARR